MNLSFIRGDTYKLTFGLKTSEGVDYVLQENDKLYFTIKKSFNHRAHVLQRTYGEGIVYNESTGKYEIEFKHEDSCHIECRNNYVYDIKVIIANEGNPIVKTLIKGVLAFDNNATHRGNE